MKTKLIIAALFLALLATGCVSTKDSIMCERSELYCLQKKQQMYPQNVRLSEKNAKLDEK